MNFDWAAGYPSRRSPVFGRQVVATSHPLAAQAGLQMLLRGGNAVDAAIATAACMTLVEPCSNGLGSDAFALVWDGQALHGLNASGPAPAAWSPARFAGLAQMPQRGWDAVTVPGAVAAWAALHQRFGRLPFADLMAPAIEIAERGYAVPVGVADKWARAARVPELAQGSGFAQAFLPRGRALQVGERFVFAEAARSLRLIADSQGEAFYRGEIAAALDAFSRAEGGALRASDLAAYQPEWVAPIATDFQGYRVHEIPPNGQGIAALMALGMARHCGLGEHPVDDWRTQHLLIEAMKLAFADTYAQVAEPAAMRVSSAQLLDPDYLRERAALIDRERAQDFGAGNPVKGGTIYLTTADALGMQVSFIQSNYMGFGSGLVLPSYGISLQNRGACFSLQPGHPNEVAGGKRPFHTIIPAFLTKDGQAQMGFGVMGGNMQPQGHLQTLVRMLVYGQNPQAACDAPRWRFNQGLHLNAEPHWPSATLTGLIAAGHQLGDIHDSYQDFGAGQFIWKLEDGYVAASDPRRDGAAVAV
ncbi:gamma-glutamyltranspeptidase/glutathione hydrolase [Inhella inkyongensis]|uniref:Gamma-glutamyltranspeptidase/glutathione hydrolase n=1 Tax=Inhella inkyongensis TaxID=392593 RepID=A0A840S001_9BURK|nr:gamma-glutamyltransferase family protein [Inhella inkyongensis]MBB5204377.1 gamma-glutamyltranspeptidase/glutathione hydrolase [Inhella inkyongensis]